MLLVYKNIHKESPRCSEKFKKKRKRVCCFCEKWASGGIESFICNVLTRIDLEQLQVDIVSSSIEKSIFTPILQEKGIRFFELSGNSKRSRNNHHYLRKLMEEHNYDVFHLNAFQGLSLSYLNIAQQTGVPIRIAHSHNTSLRRSLTKPIKMMLHTRAKKIYTSAATELWACSHNAAEFLFERQVLAHEGFNFIPNGIDTQRFRFNVEMREKMRKELGLGEAFVIGNVGRLCYQKNQIFLLDVFAELLKSNPKGRLLLVGDGEDRRYLEEKAHRLDIFDKVIFFGLAEHIEHLLWAMDVFVLPSHFEGLPVVGVEAQASGLPCVFSDTVARECELINSTKFLSLSSSHSIWSKVILHARAQTNRIEASDIVKAVGFDIGTIAKQIESSYLGIRCCSNIGE